MLNFLKDSLLSDEIFKKSSRMEVREDFYIKYPNP
jgi:hypothetical protein